MLFTRSRAWPWPWPWPLPWAAAALRPLLCDRGRARIEWAQNNAQTFAKESRRRATTMNSHCARIGNWFRIKSAPHAHPTESGKVRHERFAKTDLGKHEKSHTKFVQDTARILLRPCGFKGRCHTYPSVGHTTHVSRRIQKNIIAKKLISKMLNRYEVDGGSAIKQHEKSYNVCLIDGNVPMW